MINYVIVFCMVDLYNILLTFKVNILIIVEFNLYDKIIDIKQINLEDVLIINIRPRE